MVSGQWSEAFLHDAVKQAYTCSMGADQFARAFARKEGKQLVAALIMSEHKLPFFLLSLVCVHGLVCSTSAHTGALLQLSK